MLLFAVGVFATGQAPLPEGDGKKIVENVCTACHGLDVVTDKKMGKDDWQDVVNSMIDRGAALTKEENATVVAYLAKNFGKANDGKLAKNDAGRNFAEHKAVDKSAKNDPGRKLFEDVCWTCHELDRASKEALTKAEWTDLIKGMISEGNVVTDEEFSILVDYLAKNFGTESLHKEESR
jgi:cytochrome c5